MSAVSRRVAWERRPQAAALLEQAQGVDRSFDAVVVRGVRAGVHRSPVRAGRRACCVRMGSLFLDRPGPVRRRRPGRTRCGSSARCSLPATDVYAIRWENARTGRSGWSPAVEGGWRKGTNRPYLRLTDRVVEAHLTGEVHVGLYPLLAATSATGSPRTSTGRRRCSTRWPISRRPGRSGCPAALEVSRSGIGAHVWVFFAGPVPAATARTLGSGLLREAIALRGRMDLAGYDRLFPSQDVLPASGGIGNLIAAPLQGRSRQDGATVFLDLGDPGAARRPVGVPVQPASAVTAARSDGSPTRVGPVRVGVAVGRLVRGHGVGYPAAAGAGGRRAAGCGSRASTWPRSPRRCWRR